VLGRLLMAWMHCKDSREEGTLQGDNKDSVLEAMTTVASLAVQVVGVLVPVKVLQVVSTRPTTRRNVNFVK